MNGSGTSSTELLSALTSLGWAFPFERELSLRPLIAFWEETIAPEKSLRGRLARDLQDEVRRAPELSSPINDLSVLTRHHELVDALMAAVFPTVSWQQDHAAALIPFELRSFYATPSFERDLTGADGKLQGRLSVDKEAIARFRLLNAYSLALARIYGISFPVDYPIIFTVEDRETGLDRHFKIGFEGRFIDVEPAGTLPALAPDVRARLEARAGDFQALAAVFPPGSVRFSGFTVFRALDVTDQEVLSSLKRDLIDKESIVSSARFDTLQTRLQTLLRRPDLRLGLAAIEGDRVLELSSGASCEHPCIFADSVHRTLSDYVGSVYHRASVEGKPLFIEDLAAYPDRTAVEQNMLDNGVRSLVVSPLHYQDATIGTLLLTSPRPGDLNSLQAPRIHEVLPLFSMAVKRSADELDMRVQAFIKEKCTAIHPVVEWRFRKAVFDGLERTVLECDRSAVGDGGHRLFRRLSALRDRRHPRLVHAAVRGHPGRPPRPARARPGRPPRRPRCATAADSRPAHPSHRHVLRRHRGEPPERRRDGHHRLPPDGDRGALRPSSGLRHRASASASRRTVAPSIHAWAPSTPSGGTSTRA